MFLPSSRTIGPVSLSTSAGASVPQFAIAEKASCTVLDMSRAEDGRARAESKWMKKREVMMRQIVLQSVFCMSLPSSRPIGPSPSAHVIDESLAKGN
jgi:hypothetical protein